MLLITLLLQALALAYAFVLPGALISFAAGRDWPLPIRLLGGLALGALVVPLASFCAAWILGTNVQLSLVLAVATLVNAAAAAAWWAQRRSASTPSGEEAR